MPQPLHAEAAAVKVQSRRAGGAVPQQRLHAADHRLQQRLGSHFDYLRVLKAEKDEVRRILLPELDDRFAVQQARQLVLDVQRGNARLHADFLDRQRLLIRGETDRTRELRMQIPVRVHRTVAGDGVPLDAIVDFVHALFPYPLFDFFTSRVQPPFDRAFRQRVLIGQRPNRQAADVVIDENVPVRGGKRVQAAEHPLERLRVRVGTAIMADGGRQVLR